MSAGDQWSGGPGAPGGPGEPGGVPGTKSGGVTAMGVFNLVLGGLELLMCGAALVGGGAFLGLARSGDAKIDDTLQKAGARPEDIAKIREAGGGGLFEAIAGFIIVMAVIGLIIAALRIWAGVGVLNRRSWARTMTIVLASISILFVIFFLLGILTIQGALLFLISLGYVISAFVILLNARNAAEFRRT